MGMLKQADTTSAKARLLQPPTPMTPIQAAAHRMLSAMPDTDPSHTINFEWNMRDLQAWSQAEQELKARAAAAPSVDGKTPQALPKGPLMFGGRIWWSAAARFVSVVVLLIAIIAEALFILRDASARITAMPPDNDVLEPARMKDRKEETDRLARFAVKLVKRAAESKKNKESKFAGSANETMPECHWVNSTDVQNNGAGIPLAIAYHMFTTIILSILVLAEFKIWTYKLHPSSTLNIGIIQVWAGLACLSRAVNDMFGTIAGAALIVAGLGNIAIGFRDRFTAGGPGFMFFGTGTAPAKGGLPPAANAAGAPTDLQQAAARSSPAIPPDPKQELLESEKLAGFVAPSTTQAGTPSAQVAPGTPPGFAALYSAAAPAYTVSPSGITQTSTPSSRIPRTPLRAIGLLDPIEPEKSTLQPPESDLKPMLDQLAASNPEIYRSLLAEAARRGLTLEGEEPNGTVEARPVQVHFTDSPRQKSSSSRKSKQWKDRGTHTF